MKNNKGLVTIERLRYLEEQENELMKERFEEEANICLLAKLNKTDIAQSEYKDDYSRKLLSRINWFYKSIEDENKDVNFLLINNNDTLESFKEYLLGKVKGEEKEEYELMFKEQSFINDVKNLLKLKSFEHKQQRELEGISAFFSARAKRESSLLMARKEGRSRMHESVQRSIKTYHNLASGREKLSPEQMEQFLEVILKEMDNVLLETNNNVLSIDFEEENKMLK